MPFLRDLVTVETARDALLAVAEPLPATPENIEEVALADAAGRACAEEIAAPADVPDFDRSAMDGYAVRAADVAGASPSAPARLRLVGAIYAGARGDRPLAPGECARVGTGSMLPDGADAVARAEECRARDASVEVLAARRPGDDVVKRGSDLARGARVAGVGDELTPARLGALANVGRERARLFRLVRVAILTTGDEVVPQGQALAPGKVYDVNSFTLGALLPRFGARVVIRVHCPDDREAVARALAAALPRADLLLFAGGSSVGDKDFLPDVFAAAGEILFHGVAQRPGKPLLAAKAGRALLFGLSGNPASCLLAAYVYVLPVARRMGRLPPLAPRRAEARLERAVKSPADLHHFVPVRVGADGLAGLTFRGSGAISSLADADGYVEFPVGSAGAPAGAPVVVTFFPA
ncbi:MAG: molybdopterin molybdotransferase MoeA [Planctomycetes bacterium]|nr:molybdopterin molybdotransferase MoeA [Planctomycetota bacterium]